MGARPAAAGAGTAVDGDLSVAVNFDYEQAGELKIGQVGIANLRIRTLDVERLVQEMQERVSRAPKLFGRAAVILDFGGLSQVPTWQRRRRWSMACAVPAYCRWHWPMAPVRSTCSRSSSACRCWPSSAPSTSAPRQNLPRRRPPHRNRAVPRAPKRRPRRLRLRPRRWARLPMPPRHSRVACSWATCVRGSSCMRKTAT
ncbi:hypothetical protein B0X78_17995 [bacterium AM6]|nr:hypothetical protein B0X78_17995 [bacterium AM6]